MATASGVVIDGLHKSYGRNAVLKGIDLHFRPGRVHALLGANGAGKSTLLGCLSGATRPDDGAIRVGEFTHDGFTPREAFDAGIAIIYQHFQLIETLSVADNIFLGQELRTPLGTADRSRQNSEARRLLEQLGLHIDPATRLQNLSVGQQQSVEIARAIRRRPGVLILDEPTAALGTHEANALIDLVRHLAHNEGLAVVYVTHLLGEVLEVADEITVLRDGDVLWTAPRSEVSQSQLIAALSSEASAGNSRAVSSERSSGAEVLTLSGFRSSRTGPLDLSVNAGEIVGVYGLLGSGRTDFLESLAGVRGRTGTVLVGGVPVSPRSPNRARKAGIALVASDRKAQSLFGELPAIENLLMPHYAGLANIVRRPREEARVFDETAVNVRLTPPRRAIPANAFSGGNAQKIAVARWASIPCGVCCLLLDEPTQGVDIGARQDLYELVREYSRKNDAAVVFASSDPEEILALADRVLVLVEGRPVRLGPAAALTEFELARMAQPASTEERTTTP